MWVSMCYVSALQVASTAESAVSNQADMVIPPMYLGQLLSPDFWCLRNSFTNQP